MKRFSSVVLFLVVLGFLAYAEAEDKYWIGSSGSWHDPSQWSPYGQPQESYPWDYNSNVYLTHSDSIDRTISLTTSSGFESRIFIDATGTGTTTLSIQQGSTLASNNLQIGISGTGILNQTGGTVTSMNDMGVYLGINPGSTGIYNLSEGTLTKNNTSKLIVGGQGAGIFNQTGGQVLMDNTLIVNSLGAYNLSGTGYLSSLSTFQMIETIRGTFNQSGGFNELGDLGYLILSGEYNLSNGEVGVKILNGPGPATQIENNGTFNQSGGVFRMPQLSIGTTLNVNGKFNLSGGILESSNFVNNGTYEYSGGELHLNPIPNRPQYTGTLSNNGTVLLSGTGTRTINGDVINNGTFKTTNTVASYTGTFTNNGGYISDHASQRFKDLIIGQNGYLKGNLADFFFVSGDFKNQSALNTAWNTSFAYLGFEDGAKPIHGFYLAGQDYGAVLTGYKDNFSLGFLDLSGDVLQLYDGNNIAGGAFYAGDICGLQITDFLITNIIGMEDLNIYYLADQWGNQYLQGLTYDLTGGGHLIPIGLASVPEPASILLLGLGLAGLSVYGRRKFKAN